MPVNANLNAPANYYSGNSFQVPGLFSSAPTQIPSSLLPPQQGRLWQSLTQDQRNRLLGVGQPTPPPVMPSPSPAGAPTGLFGGGTPMTSGAMPTQPGAFTEPGSLPPSAGPTSPMFSDGSMQGILAALGGMSGGFNGGPATMPSSSIPGSTQAPAGSTAPAGAPNATGDIGQTTDASWLQKLVGPQPNLTNSLISQIIGSASGIPGAGTISTAAFPGMLNTVQGDQQYSQVPNASLNPASWSPLNWIGSQLANGFGDAFGGLFGDTGGMGGLTDLSQGGK